MIHYLPVESRVGDLVETFFENALIIVEVGKFEQYSGGRLRQGEASLEIHLLADGRSFLHGKVVGWSQQEGTFGQKVLRVRYFRFGIALDQCVDLLLPRIRIVGLKRDLSSFDSHEETVNGSRWESYVNEPREVQWVFGTRRSGTIRADPSVAHPLAIVWSQAHVYVCRLSAIIESFS